MAGSTHASLRTMSPPITSMRSASTAVQTSSPSARVSFRGGRIRPADRKLDPETRPTEAACAILKDRMKIAVAADHAGFPLKDRVIEEVRKLGHEVFDLGTHSTDPVDYPDYALAVAEALRNGAADRAILICGSGAGACVAANKFRGIRAATCHDTFSAHQGVEDDGVNVLCLGARVVGQELAGELVRTYLNAQFSDVERHRRRVAKVEQFEEEFNLELRSTIARKPR